MGVEDQDFFHIGGNNFHIIFRALNFAINIYSFKIRIHLNDKD